MSTVWMDGRIMGWQASIRATWACVQDSARRIAIRQREKGPDLRARRRAAHVQASSSVPCTHTDMRERATAALRCMQLMFSIRSISGTVKRVNRRERPGMTMHLLSMHIYDSFLALAGP
jgi:hypothetical protein